MSKNILTAADYADAAAACGCDVAAIRAVDEIESRGSGFDAQGRPTILFERHWFRKMTGSKYDRTHPHLSAGYLPPRSNPSYKRDQWTLMDEAAQLDASAAVQSASWGRFQIMGFNWRMCGCSSTQQFLERMEESAAQHLQMFVAFVMRKGLNDALRRRDWVTFAYGYNGPDHASNNYAGKLRRAYEKHAKNQAIANETPGQAVRRLLREG